MKKIDNDGIMSVEIGPETFNWDLQELSAIGNGDNAQEILKHNVAISLKLAGIDLTDEITVKQHIEKKSFKYFR